MPTVLTLIVPPPVIVRTVPSFTRPPVKVTTPPELMVALVAAVTCSVQVLVPPVKVRVPPPLIVRLPDGGATIKLTLPVPLITKASPVGLLSPFSNRVAPLDTVVPAAVAPKVPFPVTSSVPPETVVRPVYVLAPLRTNVPPVVFVSAPSPYTSVPLITKASPVGSLRPFSNRVAPLDTTVPAAVVPKVPFPVTSSMPPETVVRPVYVLAPLRTNVQPVVFVSAPLPPVPPTFQNSLVVVDANPLAARPTKRIETGRKRLWIRGFTDGNVGNWK